jgi:hypothetical protein
VTASEPEQRRARGLAAEGSSAQGCDSPELSDNRWVRARSSGHARAGFGGRGRL